MVRAYSKLHPYFQNPAPMVRAYSKPRPYSEVTEDYQLCSIPQCIPGALPAQRPYLHKQVGKSNILVYLIAKYIAYMQ